MDDDHTDSTIAPTVAAVPPRPLARPLIPVVLALMLGMIAAAWGYQLSPGLLAVMLAALSASLVLCWWRGRRVLFMALVWFFLLGLGLCQQASHPVLPPHHVANLTQDRAVTLRGHLYRSSKALPGRAQMYLLANAWLSPQGWRAATGRVLLGAPAGELPAAGTALVVRGRLRTPRTLRNPGAFDRVRYLAAEAIFREMRLQDPNCVIFLAGRDSYPAAERLRGGIRQLLRDLEPSSRAIYLAMLLGDQGEITPEMRAALARTGTSHLLVINGLHLGMVALVIYGLSFWLLRCFPWLLLRVNVMKVAMLLAAAAVMGYAWLAGGSASTQRAEVMVLAYLLLLLLGRPSEVWSALALAALAILCLAPLRLFTISFQLSFAAVAALIYFAPWMPHKTKRDMNEPGLLWPQYLKQRGKRLLAFLKVWGKESLMVSVVASLATAPLVALYFQVVSLLGILVNLAAIPLMLLLALPLGEAAVLAQTLGLAKIAGGLLILGNLPLWLGFHIIDWGARLPASAFTMPMPTWWQIILFYLSLTLWFLPRRHYLAWAGAGLAGLVLAGSIFLPLARTLPALEVTCLDSFGGLHGLVVSPEGRRLAFSAPRPSWGQRSQGGPGVLPGYCHWRQFRGLDLALALTLSADNAGELLALGRQFAVEGFWYGRRAGQGPAYWELYNFLGDRGITPRSLERNPPPRLGSVELEFIKLAQDKGLALQLGVYGGKALILPPARALESKDLPPEVSAPVRLLVLPAALAGGQEGLALIRRLSPKAVVAYGDVVPAAAPDVSVPCYATAKGAVSVYLAPQTAAVCQWR
jgi:competence protein ComEC